MGNLIRTEQPRNVIAVDVVGDNEQERAAIKAMLAEVADARLDILDFAPSPISDGHRAADLAMIVLEINDAVASLAYLQMLAERSKRPVLIALLAERSPTLIRRALHAGADETLFLPLDNSEITCALLKLRERQRKTERDTGATVWSVASLTGGVGVTSLAANLVLAAHYVLG